MKSIAQRKKGIVLILAYSVSAALLILAGATIQRAMTEFNLARRSSLTTEAFYLAEAAIEQGAYDLAQKIANYENIEDPFTQAMASISPDYSMTYEWEDIHQEITGGSDDTELNPGGVVTFTRYYQLRGTATHNDYPDIAFTVSQIIARHKTYTFQHAVFYADDLEMLPGPDMTLSGKVHSNSDIYIGANNTFTIDSDYLKTAEDFYNYRKNNGASMPGDVSIQIKDSSPVQYALVKELSDTDPLDCDRADWKTESQVRWAGTVQSAIHEVHTLAVPAVGSIQVGGYYDTNSDVRVENGTVKKGGITLVEGVDIPNGTLQTTSFYNHREGKMTKITNVDMRKLAGYAEGDPDGSPSFPNNLPDNGLMYTTRTDAQSDEMPGVRLVNGKVIHSSAGLTVVSDVPLYIQGDYNMYDYDGDSNKDKKPAAVISDSVNILSNDWQDSNSEQSDSLSARKVSDDVEVNTAFIAGIKPTPDGGGNYSGGLENYPRLLEDWGGDTLKIRGSFVELWESSVADGDWTYGGNQYKAPVRNWDYDTDFNDSNNLPPFTPYAIETERVSWWTG